MNKIFILILLYVLPFSFNFALADGCATGYACLLKDLNDQNEVIQEIQKERVDRYFNPALKQVRDKDEKNESYRDILPLLPKYNLVENL